jgi:uncharacterized protein YjiS (DUF1127 family)
MHFPDRWSVNGIAAPSKISFGLAPINLERWGRWISLITAIVAKLWLRMARDRQIRRMRTAWATIDDRTLRDIGVSRWEVAYAESKRAPGSGYESDSALQPGNWLGVSRRWAKMPRHIS